MDGILQNLILLNEIWFFLTITYSWIIMTLRANTVKADAKPNSARPSVVRVVNSNMNILLITDATHVQAYASLWRLAMRIPIPGKVVFMLKLAPR